jgi:peptide deformylase
MRRVISKGAKAPGVKADNSIRFYTYKLGDTNDTIRTPPKLLKSNTKLLIDAVERMKYYASTNGFCALSANQVYERYCMFVCLKKPLLVPHQWDGYE